MKVLDFWPFISGRRYPNIVQAVEPNDIVQEGADGIDHLLSAIDEHQPDVLIGDFGVRTRGSMGNDERFLRELREKHPNLPIVICGTSAYSSRWREIASEIKCSYYFMPRRIKSGCLNEAIDEAAKLVA